LSDFSQDFPAITVAPVRNLDGKQQLRLFIDRCSVEMFGTAGEWVMTNLVFPTAPYTNISVQATGKAKLQELTVYPLTPTL
jgi:fructan beta-fructosidase